jgi:hypothetical protein
VGPHARELVRKHWLSGACCAGTVAGRVGHAHHLGGRMCASLLLYWRLLVELVSWGLWQPSLWGPALLVPAVPNRLRLGGQLAHSSQVEVIYGTKGALTLAQLLGGHVQVAHGGGDVGMAQLLLEGKKIRARRLESADR